MNLADLLRRAAEAEPAKVALAFGPTEVERELSYAALDEQTDRVAGGLRDLGVGAGDRVAIAMPNVPQFVSAYFGVLRAGAVAVPLNTMLSESELAAVLRDATPTAVLGAGAFGELAQRAAAEVLPGARAASVEGFDSAAVSPMEPTAGDDDLAVLAYTAGTTGRPKGVMLSHSNLLANLEQQMAIPRDHVETDDVLLLSLPLFHIFGLNVPLGLLVSNAASGVLLERFEPVPSLRAIQERKVTVLFGAPPMYLAWVNTPGADQYDLSRVRLAISGAAPLPLNVLSAFRDIFGVEIDEGYGLTETAPTLTSNRAAPALKSGSVGQPLPGVQLRVVDDSGTDVEVGDPGEIAVRGANVFKGYWNQPEETARVVKEGWFYTGDIGVRDDEGYVHLVDRKRDLVIVSGFNVFPSEVEAALLANPRIQEAAVVGAPHEYRGETLRAYVVLEPETRVSESELLEDVRTRLARFKWPESIEIVDSLPHLLTGKVLRRALRSDVETQTG
jgi:long-chain acyl-CoA synthetase